MYERNPGGIGESIMVRVNARFELTTVRVIGSQQESACSSSSWGRSLHFSAGNGLF